MNLEKLIRCSLIMLLFLILCSILQAQDLQVKNVRFEDRENIIVVHYDLQGKFGKKYNISLYLSDDYGRTFKIQPQDVLGDVGKDIEAGKYKKIIWNIKEDYPNGLNGDRFVFAVEAELQKGRKIWPYFLVGVAGVAGGVLYYISMSEEETPNTGSIIIDVSTDF